MKRDLVIFGTIWAMAFLSVGVYPLFNSEQPKIWAIVCAVAFFLIVGIYPNFFKIFYNIWLKFGNFVTSANSKLILFVIFFGVFTPVSFVLKFLKIDLLRKKNNTDKTTYWINRKNQPQSMKNQF